MNPWDRRPIEIRNLFNPAFCGLVLFRSFVGYEEADARGMPFSLALLVLPLCLQKQSREILAASSRGYFLRVIAERPEMRVGFAARVSNMMPFTFEALGLLMQQGTFRVTSDGRLKSIAGLVKKTVTGTDESVSCQRVGRFVGKQFASIGDRATVYATLGVKP